MLSDLAFSLGLTNGNSWTYLFWSGFFGDVTKLTLIVGLGHLWWAHRCHVKSCWRTGRFPLEGSPWTVCAKHHPCDPPSPDELRGD